MTEGKGPSDSVLKRIEGFARTSHDSGYEQGYVDAYRDVRRLLARRALVYLMLGLLLGGTIVLLAAQRGMLGETFSPRARDPIDLGVGRGMRYREAAEFAKDYTVAIRTARDSLWTRSAEAIGGGSGFLFDDKGHIVTNHHVLRGATRFDVTWRGMLYPAVVVGSVPSRDIAVLRIDAPGLTAAPMLEPGESVVLAEEVLAVGAPFGLEHSVTQGIVSFVGRWLSRDDGPYIQTDCAINPGNSGGPLVNLQGRVVAMNRMIHTIGGDSAGIGFAIPIDDVRKAAQDIIAEEARRGAKSEPPGGRGESIEAAYIGFTPAFTGTSRTSGVVVATVAPDTPAERAGLQPGDVLRGIDGFPIRNLTELQRALVQWFTPGTECTLFVERGGQPLRLKLVLGRRPGSR